jgi:ABC-type transporter MlaC component
MKTMFLLIVFGMIFLLSLSVSAVFVSMQVVNGQNDNSTGKSMVDKLIQDTKRENATEESYRAELIQRMQNTTCLNTNLEGIGSVPLNTDILKTSELEGLLKTCVKEGIIK